jgi:hypothetical protein
VLRRMRDGPLVIAINHKLEDLSICDRWWSRRGELAGKPPPAVANGLAR